MDMSVSSITGVLMASSSPPSESTYAGPSTLAWIGHASRPPTAIGDWINRFDDSDDFLLSTQAFSFDFYVVHLRQQGVQGMDLIRLIRRRSAAGIVAIGHTANDEFAWALDAGADAVVDQDAPAHHLVAAIAAVRRRISQGGGVLSASSQGAWTLLESQSLLKAPDGTRIPLSGADLAIMQCFAAAQGARVDRRLLVERLWGTDAGTMDNALHATLYRLRKRIEQAGQSFVPVHAIARVGYEFRARLLRS